MTPKYVKIPTKTCERLDAFRDVGLRETALIKLVSVYVSCLTVNLDNIIEHDYSIDIRDIDSLINYWKYGCSL